MRSGLEGSSRLWPQFLLISVNLSCCSKQSFQHRIYFYSHVQCISLVVSKSCLCSCDSVLILREGNIDPLILFSSLVILQGFPGGCICQCRFDPWGGEVPWRRKWQPTSVLLSGKSHGERSLAGYRLRVANESDMN